MAWGEVRLVEFGRPDKTRPALILTRSRVIGLLSQVTVAPITRTIRDIPSELRLGIESGLKVASVANLDSLFTVAKERVGRYLGTLAPSRRRELRDALLFAFQLDEELA
ncbi:MAG: type II toxin-antitoxin system PemK/MazF family toxin [Myxococcales bacterium]|nr:type II toxin-antitoxin system PemK/MazF family toxin [Myxococcales bacterium]